LNGSIPTRYPPGYPLVLASLFATARLTGLPEQFFLSALAALAMGVSSALLFATAHSVWGLKAALVSGVGWMSYPFALWLTKQPNSEIPFIVLLYAAFYALWHSADSGRRLLRLALLAGLLIGFATLIRPMGIGLGLVLAATLFLRDLQLSHKAKLSAAALLLLGNGVVLLPWQFWLYSRTHQAIVLSTGSIPSIRDGLTFAVLSRGYRQGIKVPADARALMEDIRKRYYTLQSFGDIASLIGENARQRPVALAELISLKMARSWYATDSQRMELQILLIQIVYLLCLAYCTSCAWKQGGKSRDLALVVWLIAAYFWG